MILREQENDQLPKLPFDPIHGSIHRTTGHDPESLVHRSSSPIPSLPDYEASQAQAKLEEPPLVSLIRSRTKTLSNSRWFRAFWYMIIFYAVVVGLIVVPFLVMTGRWPGRGPHHALGPHPPLELELSSLYGTDLSVDMTLLAQAGSYPECNTWRDKSASQPAGAAAPTYIASLSFAFPILSTLQISAASASSNASSVVSGQFSMGINSDPSVKDVSVLLDVVYSREDFFEAVSVCHTQTHSKSIVALLFPDDLQADDVITCNLTVLIPQSSSTLSIPRLTTQLPYFQQIFRTMSPGVEFGNVSVNGWLQPITFDAIRAHNVVIQTSDAKVAGRFNITHTLSVGTVNGPIEVDVLLSRKPHAKRPNSVVLDTGNAHISANVILYLSEPSHFDQPDFSIEAATFSADLNMSVAHDAGSAPSHMIVDAQTTQGPIAFELDALFQGTFDIATKSDTATIERNELTALADPDVAAIVSRWFQGTRHIVSDFSAPGRLLGWVGYGNRPAAHKPEVDSQSHISLSTSLSPVTLTLDELPQSG